MAKYQNIKIKDYGDDWINRLAVILKTIEKMDRDERNATLEFVFNKFQQRIEA